MASLVIVGSGIKFFSHLTIEAKAYIEKSDKVLYLVNEPVMKEWLKKTSRDSESLDALYTQHRLRIHSYQAITNHIMQEVYKQQHVCVVIYGHPTIFAQPALDAAIQAKKAGFVAKILPGISSEACLFADLMIDPASHGCMSFEATDLLIHQRKLDHACHVILWQVSVIGMLEHARNHNNQPGIIMLRDYLLNYYPSNHKLILYSAALYPGFDPSIHEFEVNQLTEIEITRTSTLYIPPLKKAAYAKNVIQALNMNFNDLTSGDN